MADAFRPRTTIDDSQFQGIISIYTTRRTVAQEMPLPSVGDALTLAWGDYAGHVIIARGSEPAAGNAQKSVWIQHLPAPATLEAQNAYNFARTGDGMVSRFYVMKRADYGTPTYLTARPAVGTADPANDRYKFATESVSKIGSDPNSLFIALERIYLLSPRVSRVFDDELEAEVLRTTTVIPAGTGTASSGGGVTVEIQDRDDMYDLQITDAIGSIDIVSGLPVLTPFTYPRELPSLPSDSNYAFPPLLRAASIEAAWAYADSPQAALAYDEAWRFAYDLVEPAPGPYEARIRRFLVTDPNELASSFTVDTPPATPREVIGIASWWAAASDKGNSAFAEAREEVLPAAIHDALTIDLNGIQALSERLSTTELAATPGFQEFAARKSMVIGFEPHRTRYGLYLIHVIELNLTGIYGGSKVPLGSVEGDGGNTGATIPGTSTKPLAPTAAITGDNATVSGTTYPNATVTIVDSTTAAVVGRATADASGAFSATLTATYLDAVALTVTVRYGNQTSFPTTVTTNDLTPGAPTGYLNGAGTSLNGVAQPGSTVNIAYSTTRQVVTVEVSGTVSGDGDLTVDVLSDLFATQVLTVPVLTGQSAATVAGLIVAAATANATVNADYAASAVGADVFLTARAAAADDTTLACNITGDLGIIGAFSVAGTPAVVPATATTAAHATTGAYSKTFSPALAVGSTVTVSATDAAGTGPTLTLTVTASPPTLTSATFPDSTSITGSSSAAAVVRAYLAGTQIGIATADGSGNYDITVTSLIRGEVVTVVAELATDATVKSAPLTATAPNLNLEAPTLAYTSAGWIGTKPAGSTSIVYRLESGGPETVVTPHANGNFTFNLPTFAGEAYLVVARYPAGDSDPVQINAQNIPRDPIRILAVALGPGWHPSYFSFATNGHYANVNGITGVSKTGYASWQTSASAAGDDGMFVYVPFEAGMSVTFTFPGQALNPIVHAPTSANAGDHYRYKPGSSPLTGMSSSSLPPLMNIVATYADGRSVSASFDRANMSFKYVPSSFGV